MSASPSERAVKLRFAPPFTSRLPTEHLQFTPPGHFMGSVVNDRQHHFEEKIMRRASIAGVTIILAIGGPTLRAHAQDPSARCVSVANKQMTIDSAQGRGLYIENFSEAETVAFLKAFNATPPNSNFIATKMFAAVGGDRTYVFFESGKDFCTPPSPLSRESYEAFVEQAQGDGA
jgi:hypothetical protein